MVTVAGDPAKMKEIMDKCQGQYPITPEEVQSLKALTVPDNTNGKCYVGCLFETIGLLVDGQFSRANAEALAKTKMEGKPEELDKFMQLIEQCSDQVANHNDKCETGPKLMECIKNVAPGLGIVLAGSQ